MINQQNVASTDLKAVNWIGLVVFQRSMCLGFNKAADPTLHIIVSHTKLTSQLFHLLPEQSYGAEAGEGQGRRMRIERDGVLSQFETP